LDFPGAAPKDEKDFMKLPSLSKIEIVDAPEFATTIFPSLRIAIP